MIGQDRTGQVDLKTQPLLRLIFSLVLEPEEVLARKRTFYFKKLIVEHKRKLLLNRISGNCTLLKNAGGEHDRLPTASTCMNLLKLPDFRVIREGKSYLMPTKTGVGGIVSLFRKARFIGSKATSQSLLKKQKYKLID